MPALFSPEEDGLAQPWDGVCWMNPPYGRTIGYWLKKAYESSLDGATVVCLVPARTDTTWWHDNVTRADDVRFLRGRVHFGGAANGAPFPISESVLGYLPTLLQHFFISRDRNALCGNSLMSK